MPRDPLLDPQPGDRVRANSKTRLIMERRAFWDVYYLVEGHTEQGRHCCLITTWRSWCSRNKAEVVEEE